jgi:hypothetical protein
MESASFPTVAAIGTDPTFAAGDFAMRSNGTRDRLFGTTRFSSSLRRRRNTKQMIAAVIVLSLISLLVATDSEPVGSAIPPTPEPPLRPGKKMQGKASLPQSDRIAA